MHTLIHIKAPQKASFHAKICHENICVQTRNAFVARRITFINQLIGMLPQDPQLSDHLYNARSYSHAHECRCLGKSSLFALPSLVYKHRQSHSEKGSRRTTCALVLSFACDPNLPFLWFVFNPFLRSPRGESRTPDQTARWSIN